MKFVGLIIGLMLIIVMAVPGFADIVGVNDSQVRAVADPMLDSILDGLKEDNYWKYSRNFDDTLKKSISEERFSEIRGQIEGKIGNCLYREYLGYLNREKMTIVLWRAKFDKSDNDIMIKLTVSKINDQNLVTGLWFE